MYILSVRLAIVKFQPIGNACRLFHFGKEFSGLRICGSELRPKAPNLIWLHRKYVLSETPKIKGLIREEETRSYQSFRVLHYRIEWAARF